jgi:hypothetical protein
VIEIKFILVENVLLYGWVKVWISKYVVRTPQGKNTDHIIALPDCALDVLRTAPELHKVWMHKCVSSKQY